MQMDIWHHHRESTAAPVAMARSILEIEIQSFSLPLSSTEANRINELNASSSTSCFTWCCCSIKRNSHSFHSLNKRLISSCFFLFLFTPIHVESSHTKLSMIMTMMACAWSDNSSPRSHHRTSFLCVLFSLFSSVSQWCMQQVRTESSKFKTRCL